MYRSYLHLSKFDVMKHILSNRPNR